MKTKRTRWWLKSAALLCATVFGLTAFGSYYEWAATGKAYWDGEDSWTLNGEGDITDRRAGNNGSEIAFAEAETDSDTYLLGFYAGNYTFSADTDAAGLTRTSGDLAIGMWGAEGYPSTLNIANGTYTFGTVNVGPKSTGALNLNDGTFAATALNVQTAGSTLTLNGGTLVLNGNVTGPGSLAVGENGGTIEAAGDDDRTISTALTGSGTLTKTGSRELYLTGDVSGFTGTITVAEGGSVHVGQDIEITAGQTKDFAPDTTYYWTGAANDGNLWATPGNWLVGGEVPTAPPAADSVVVIPEGEGELTIKCAGDTDYTGYLTINRNVILATKGGNEGIVLRKVDGTGTLTLQGGGSKYFQVYPVSGTAEFEIDCNLNISNWVYFPNRGSGKEKWSSALTLKGALSGTGKITCNTQAGQPGIKFYGDTSNFKGSYSGGSRSSGSRDGTEFCESARGSADASWAFGSDLSSNAGYSPFNAGNNVTYKFGQLTTIFDDYNRLTFETYHKSSNSDYASNVIVEVGGKANSTSTVGGAINGTNNKIVKVGTTSTLNFTASESVGTVEAKEGTTVILGTVAPAAVKFTGTDATIKIANTVGTYETQTIVDTPAVEDDPTTTDVDESAPAVTHEETVQTAGFAPGLGTELANCQIAADTTTEEGYTIYTLVKVATAGETQYYTIADAIAALAEAEDKTVTLIRDTTETVVIPTVGYTLVMDGFTAGSVAGAPGVAVEYNEETGTYTTVDNSEATWKGAAAGANWADAANWSTGRLPDAGTKVVFNYDAIVFLTGCNNHDCGEFNIAQGKEVTLAPVDYNQENWPRVRVSGDITSKGECTLKLFRCGVDNAKADGSAVAVRPTIQFENNGTKDSWMTGSFDFASGFTGTGLFIAYGSNGSGRLKFTTGSITVPAGSVVDFRGGNYPTYGGSGGVISAGGLNGDGRVIIHTIPDNNVDRTYFQAAFKNAEKWTGTCELAGTSIGGIDAANYGNANSTVCFNGVSGYLRYSVNSTTEVGKVKTIEIGANGLTLNNGFSSGTFGYIIAADITGSGPMHFGTRHNDAAVGQYFLTGSLDGFTGAIDFGDLQSYRPAVIIKDASTYAPAVNDYGQIIVAAERTVTVSGAWNAPGGFVVLGNVNVASTGSITSTNGLCGDGTVTYAAIPATAPGCFAGGTSSGTNREIPAWTGTVVLPARTGSGAVPLAGLGTTGSKIVVNGITGTDANSIYLSDASAINGTVEIAGAVKLTNGSTGANYTFAEVTGTGDMFLSATGAAGSPYYTYTFTKLTDYTGEINAVKTSDSKYAALAIGTVAVSEVVPGTPVVKLAANSNLTTDPAEIAVEVAGEATDATLIKAADGNLYVAVASVTVTPEEGDPVTTPFATYDAAVAAADEAGVTTVTVLYGDGAVNGWDYDSETGTLTKNTTAIARVGTTQYDTLAAAVAAEGATEIVLFGASAENVTLTADQTLDVTTSAYTGKVTGSGMFVIDWDSSAATSSTAWVLDNYGVAGSTVVVAQPIAHGYLKKVGSNAPPSIAPAVYLKANVSLDNGYAGSSQATTFAQLGADEGVTLSFRYLANAQTKDATYYTITKLKDFAGAFVLNAYNQVTVESVELAATPAFGTKVVNATIADTASLSGKIADGYPLVAKADGLYFDPVAQVGEAYYNTLAEAIAAANGGNTVTLVADTTDGYTLAAGDSFSIAWNGHTTGEIVKPTGDFYNTESYNDETGTTAYTCTAAIGILTIGQTVTPITTAEAAFNGFMAQTTPAGSTLRFFTANPLAELSVPCATYDAETLTYTKLTAVAQIGTGDYDAVQYPTLAEACAAAEKYGYDTVTLLVALGEQTVPDGWDYKDPETSGTEFGTLTKEMTVTYNVWFVDTDGSTPLAAMQTVESGATATKPAEDPVKEGKVFVAWTLGGSAYDFSTPVTSDITLIASWEDAPTGTETDDGSGNKFTVPATVATPVGKTLTDAATGTINYAQAYALGLWDGTAEGKVAEPTVSINIVNGKVQVAFAGGTVPEAYTVTSILQYKTALDTTSEWQNVEGDGATGALGATLVDQSEMGANKFYRVIVTITNK